MGGRVLEHGVTYVEKKTGQLYYVMHRSKLAAMDFSRSHTFSEKDLKKYLQ